MLVSVVMCHVCCSEPVQRRDAVDGFEAAACRHHIEAVAAVTGHVQVVSGVSVLHHDDEPRPAVSQVVTGHPLPTLTHTASSKQTYQLLLWFVDTYIHLLLLVFHYFMAKLTFQP